SSSRPNSFTASASAVFASGASMVPRLWARERRIVTRQRRSVSLGGFFEVGMGDSLARKKPPAACTERARGLRPACLSWVAGSQPPTHPTRYCDLAPPGVAWLSLASLARRPDRRLQATAGTSTNPPARAGRWLRTLTTTLPIACACWHSAKG